MVSFDGSVPARRCKPAGWALSATRAFLSLGVERRRFSAFARSIARKPSKDPSAYLEILPRLVAALLGDRRETVIGGDDDIGVAARPNSSSALRAYAKVVVGILSSADRSIGPLIPGVMTASEAVAGVVLAAVGIAGPEHQHERLVAGLGLSAARPLLATSACKPVA